MSVVRFTRVDTHADFRSYVSDYTGDEGPEVLCISPATAPRQKLQRRDLHREDLNDLSNTLNNLSN